MIQIRPISDLRNNFSSIESIVNSGSPVYLTKNGYGSMVVLSLEQYSRLTDSVELALDEADRYAASTTERLTHEEVFSRLRSAVNGKQL
ncbi:MAG: type II toxin-antitoxin system Phd/YefM family antitoxin [Spirochaetales bacterium]|nr:type II toxin-antitoxin system Phd/YefM family antitoxin [Spirochaetales bacterium]MBR1582510.1 type II toxin-antitoxin system Phd/YefM family antitoxin [Spirochaetales bacterium]